MVAGTARVLPGGALGKAPLGELSERARRREEQMNPITLAFRSSRLEYEYIATRFLGRREMLAWVAIGALTLGVTLALGVTRTLPTEISPDHSACPTEVVDWLGNTSSCVAVGLDKLVESSPRSDDGLIFALFEVDFHRYFVIWLVLSVGGSVALQLRFTGFLTAAMPGALAQIGVLAATLIPQDAVASVIAACLLLYAPTIFACGGLFYLTERASRARFRSQRSLHLVLTRNRDVLYLDLTAKPVEPS